MPRPSCEMLRFPTIGIGGREFDQLGILDPTHPQGVITGAELDGLSDEALVGRVPAIAVYARVTGAHKLRIFVRVPQTLARAVEPGQRAEMSLAELPGRKFEAKVVRTAGPWSRTRARC